MLVIKSDGVIERFGKALAGLSDQDATKVFVRALNRGGDMARTKVKRSLVQQTGIKYGLINQAAKTKRATKHRLEYEFEARGDETNLNLFGARQRKKGVSAAPWRKRRIFGSTFIVAKYGGRVFRRTGDERGPIEPLYGPNIARELMRDPTIHYWREVDGFVSQRVEHELMRLFAV